MHSRASGFARCGSRVASFQVPCVRLLRSARFCHGASATGSRLAAWQGRRATTRRSSPNSSYPARDYGCSVGNAMCVPNCTFCWIHARHRSKRPPSADSAPCFGPWQSHRRASHRRRVKTDHWLDQRAKLEKSCGNYRKSEGDSVGMLPDALLDQKSVPVNPRHLLLTPVSIQVSLPVRYRAIWNLSGARRIGPHAAGLQHDVIHSTARDYRYVPGRLIEQSFFCGSAPAETKMSTMRAGNAIVATCS